MSGDRYDIVRDATRPEWTGRVVLRLNGYHLWGFNTEAENERP